MFESTIFVEPREQQEVERLREKNRVAKRLSRARQKQLEATETTSPRAPELQESSENGNLRRSSGSNGLTGETAQRKSHTTPMLGSIYDNSDLVGHVATSADDDLARFGDTGTVPVLHHMTVDELSFTTGHNHISLSDSLQQYSMNAQPFNSLSPYHQSFSSPSDSSTMPSSGSMPDITKTRGLDEKSTSKLLQIAIRNGTVEIASSLIKAGANVNSVDSSGSSPLHLAVEQRRLDVLELLIKYGANINARNSEQMTPLEMAVRAQDKQNVDIPLSKGAQIY